jgi:hypothetical protein
MDLGDAQVALDFINTTEVQSTNSYLIDYCVDTLYEQGYAPGHLLGEGTSALGLADLAQSIEEYNSL